MPNVVCGSGLSILDSESVFSKAYVLQLNFRRELKLDTKYLNNKIVILVAYSVKTLQEHACKYEKTL
jgi:hypothetical protein